MDKRFIEIVDLDSDPQASADRLVELKAGRNLQDIPITDEYWKAIKKAIAAAIKRRENG